MRLTVSGAFISDHAPATRLAAECLTQSARRKCCGLPEMALRCERAAARRRRTRSVNTARLVGLLAVLVCCEHAFAQPADDEPAAIVELGGAASWNLKNAGSSFGPDLAVEVTPIENWLEIEAGTTPLFARHSTEWDTDLLFKKPWTLSEKVEFMFGVGPEWIHTREYGVTTNSLGGEVVLDFMFWPSAKHKFGWYLEPGYEYNFGRGNERSVGISGGLLIGISKPHRSGG